MTTWLNLILISCLWQFGGLSDVTNVANGTVPRITLYEKLYSKYEGDIYLAAMFSMRHSNGAHGCGRIIDQDGLQVITAAAFAIDMVRKTMTLPVRIGLLAIDTCQDPDYGLEQSKGFMLFRSCDMNITFTCSDNSAPRVKEEYKSLQRIYGIFGAGNSDVSIMAATYVRLVSLPQISFFSTSPELSDDAKYPGFFRTIPSDLYTVKAIAQILRIYNWNFILIVHDDSKYSKSTVKSFEAHVKDSNKDNNTVCVYKTIVIQQDNRFKDFRDIVDQIKGNTSGDQQPKVVLTFFTQAIIEDLLTYTENNQVLEFTNLIWIGTDSWGGRRWPNVTKSNPLMNKAISIIPRSTTMPEFMEYYRKRLPAVDDYNPWLAKKFEDECHCQYSNTNLFIYPELMKIRKLVPGSVACEPIEHNCSTVVYKDSIQMPYIHYVMDGILAYGQVMLNLIGRQCDGMNYSECANFIWQRPAILNYSNMLKELKIVQFKDSTNKTFKFWNERDGSPSYSVVYFNKSTDSWIIVGSLDDYKENGKEFDVEITNIFDKHLRENNHISPCSYDCKMSEKRKFHDSKCCWDCVTCKDQYVNKSSILGNDDICLFCPKGQKPNANSTGCNYVELKLMSLNEVGASIIFISDLIGLLYCCITFVVMVAYWNTPIIKAFGKETSSIILLGTVLSFTFSMVLLFKPTDFICMLYWFSPGFCSTICYASILAKTNRIVRIFSMNWSSKKKANPKFVSPMSQISIIGFITLLEACLLCIIISLKNVKLEVNIEDSKRELRCLTMDAGNLVATFLIPILLLLASTFYAFKMRKTPDGFNETRNINFMNFANCVVLVTSLFLYQLLSTYEAVYPLCLQMTLGAYGNLVGLFTPKIYLVICRPEKNTLECVTARSRTRSTMSFTQPNTPNSDINLGNLRCRKCNTLLCDSLNSDQENKSGTSSLRKNTNTRSQTKVFFVEDNSRISRHKDSDNVIDDGSGLSNQAYNEDF